MPFVRLSVKRPTLVLMARRDDDSCNESMVAAAVSSPMGDLELSACVHGLHRLARSHSSAPVDPQIKVKFKDSFEDSTDNKWIKQAFEWLVVYFESAGRLSSVEEPYICPTILRTEFNRKVWTTLKNSIRFGETITYSELAVKAVGKPMASRAVGTAMKRNPICLIIPCHRVIKKDGIIGQYSAGGYSVKEWLLSHEQRITSK